MKKGVLSKRVCILLLSILLIASLSLSALGGETGAGAEAGIGIEVGTSPSTIASGYWVLKTLDSEGNEITHYSTKGDQDTLLPPDYSNLDDYFSAMPDKYYNWLNVGAVDDNTDNNQGWTFPLPEVYSFFKLTEPYNEEATYLRFVLDPEPFKLEGYEDIYASHSGTPTFDYYENPPCADCQVIDNPEYCDALESSEFTCLNINILARKDCSEMSDWNQQFCEGAPKVGGNRNSDQADDPLNIDPSAIGISGYGGCRLYETEGTDPSMARLYGRDWYTAEMDDGFFSPDFSIDGFDGDQPDYTKEEKVIGRCCGNEVEDVGALSKDTTEYFEHPNAYICYNETSDERPIGDFKWAYAQKVDYLYKILELKKGDSEFDAVSNGWDWYVCNTTDGVTASLYKPLETDTDGTQTGVLVPEYGKIAKGPNPVSSGTKPLGGGGNNYGDGTGSNAPYDLTGKQSDDIIDEDSFSSTEYDVTGGAVATSCDKDGDGYDGPWWHTGTGPDRWHDTSVNPCENPKQPYDCDDWLADDGEPLDLEKGQYGVSNIARLKHPGAINYCINGQNFHLDCRTDTECIANPTGDTSPESMFTNPDARFMIPRFICHDEDEKGSFAECCGWDTAFCFNKKKGRREGSAIHTLREFNTYTTISGNPDMIGKTNFVLRYGISKAPLDTADNRENVGEDGTYTLALFTSNDDLNITDWSHYKNLEFYIWYTANFEVELWLGKYVKGEGYSEYNLDNYNFPFKKRITDYVVNEPALGKWLHVVIPIDDIFQGGVVFEPDVIVFASNVWRLMDLQTIVTLDGDKYSNIVGIDKIFLQPKESDLPDGVQNFYCSGTWPPVWLTDLDQTSHPDIPAEISGMPAGRDACESIPSYGWTGTQCCGDDTGNDTASGRIGQATSKEYYSDTDAGCWAGNKIAEDQRAMLVQYNMAYSGFDGLINRTCTNYSCVYEIPQVQNILIQNPNPQVYDLAFVNGESRPIGIAGLSPNDHSSLKAENIPLQVLFSGGSFFGCNAENYIMQMEDTVNGDKLIDENNLLESTGDTCAVKGSYYCDHADGANMGWRDEAVDAAPDSTTITGEDDVEIEDAVFEGKVAATYRSYAKRNFNLIKDGGFENV